MIVPRLSRLPWYCALALACGRAPPDPPAPKSGELPPGAVAAAGGAVIHSQTVQRIASAAGISLVDARERAIFDALFANEAAQRLGAPPRAVIERAALGRSMLELLLKEAAQRGAPTDEEIEALTRERWVELDRPPGARVTHAVVLRGKENDTARARELAEALATALRGITDPEAFSAAAQSMSRDGFTVRAERLPPMTPDGRAFSLNGVPLRGARHFDETFAAAANQLASPGEQSPIVETRAGYHVILLEEKFPEVRVPLADRRRVLERDVFSQRAGQLRRALIEQLASKVPVEVSRDFAARTEGLGGS